MYKRSIDPDTREDFWREEAEKVHWFKKPETILDSSNAPLYRWYSDGETNICYNAIDRHIEEGRGDCEALIYDSAYLNLVRKYTYKELHNKVGRLGSVLAKTFGVTAGDRVLIYMPMIPEAIFAMLACARIGAIHSVVFGGFAASELSNRIDDSTPKLIITASCGIEPKGVIKYIPIVDEALEKSNATDTKRLIVQRHDVYFEQTLNESYVDYFAEMANMDELIDAVPLPSNHELYILYTSGTTGTPKGIVRDTGGTIVALNWVMDKVFNVHKDSTFFAASDIGWVVGHSFIVYGPLIRGATSILFEGKPVGTPDPGTFWRVAAQHGAHCIYAAPTAVRVIKKFDYEGEFMKKYDLSKLKTFHLVGERCDPDTIRWLTDKFPGIFLNDNWW